MDATGQQVYKHIAEQQPFNSSLGARWDYAPRAASQALHSAGIPGIKYLDQGSRGLNAIPFHVEKLNADTGKWEYHGGFETRTAAQLKIDDPLDFRGTGGADKDQFRIQENKPTHNYVIFDPSNLTITARNGQRVYPVDHDPFAEGAPKLSPVDHDPFQEPGK